MKNFLNKLDYLKVLFYYLLISFSCLTITRGLFHVFNLSKFGEIGFKDYFTGALFDIYTIGIFFIPFYCFYLLPFHKRANQYYKFFVKFLFHITNTVLIVLNLIDVEFFKFTFKRSGYDVIQMMSYGNDFSNLLGTFLVDYWYLVILAIALIIYSEFLVRKIPVPINHNANPKTYIIQSIALFILVPLLIIMGRGGLGVRPVGILHAGKFVELKNIPFVLNTGFTFIKSINDVPLQEKKYFPKSELNSYFNPYKKIGGQPRYKNQNVVLLIMESFSQEFIGKFSGRESYTPFLDSLCDESMIYPNFWANGKRSIEALPGIANSIPSLMETPYISSSFSGNDIHSLPDELKKLNYDSYFFHGASNGSMNFDAYCKAIGYDKYYGRTEYNNEKHFDGNWGIYDEYFLPWSAKEIPNKESPFFATIFSLSSHHPYKIPKKHKFKFKEGPEKIFKAINYADFCLKKFFEEAKKQDWYENTIFIITADHTSDSKDKYYGDRLGQYSIPLVIFHPNDKNLVGIDSTTCQQADIFPSVVDLVSSKETDIYSFGNSLFAADSKPYAINYSNGLYYYFEDEYVLVLFKEEPTYLFNLKKDKKGVYNLIESNPVLAKEMTMKLLAIIQSYNNGMIHNSLNTNE